MCCQLVVTACSAKLKRNLRPHPGIEEMNALLDWLVMSAMDGVGRELTACVQLNCHPGPDSL